MRRLLFLFLTFFILIISSCDNNYPEERIPFVYVEVDINLNNLQYANLRNPGGYVYYDAGYKGLIIYHEGNGVYRVFDRACTYDPNADCIPVETDESGLFMIHKCCTSTFSFNGNPTGGPASLDLVEYRTYVDGIYLKIRNN